MQKKGIIVKSKSLILQTDRQTDIYTHRVHTGMCTRTPHTHTHTHMHTHTLMSTRRTERCCTSKKKVNENKISPLSKVLYKSYLCMSLRLHVLPCWLISWYLIKYEMNFDETWWICCEFDKMDHVKNFNKNCLRMTSFWHHFVFHISLYSSHKLMTLTLSSCKNSPKWLRGKAML